LDIPASSDGETYTFTAIEENANQYVLENMKYPMLLTIINVKFVTKATFTNIVFLYFFMHILSGENVTFPWYKIDQYVRAFNGLP
jgi:hypothetical protein